MQLILNAQEMKFCDKKTIECFFVPSMVLMERAALAVVEELDKSGFDLENTIVFCGGGNNGGDGIAVARILSERFSRLDKSGNVTIVFTGNQETCTEQTKQQLAIARAYNLLIYNEISDEIRFGAYTTVIDAVFGIGINRSIEGKNLQVIECLNQMSGHKLAIDIPSGISTDNGQVMGCAVKVDKTVTFEYLKRGLLLYPGADYAGDVTVKDIGITRQAINHPDSCMFSYEKADLNKLLPVRRADSNKATYGKVTLIVGSEGMAGAAYFAGEAAYRMGCGMVRIVTPEENRTIIQGLLPEAILTVYDKDNIDVGIIERALQWADTVGVGCGLGTSTASLILLQITLRKSNKPLVIDADALNLIAENMELKELLKRQDAPVVITPHMGEMSRLTKKPIEQIKREVVECAEAFAKEYRVTCILKDARTIVANEGEASYLNLSGNHGMATAGSGDVLTGILTGLLASGMNLPRSASLGVWIHGLAAEAMTTEKGARGLLARDLITGISRVVRRKEDETVQQSICTD